MTRFKRLTVEEARAMTRADLLDRLEAEGEYWARKLKHGTEKDWQDYRVYQECLHMIDPGEAVGDTLAWLQGDRTAGGYFDTRPVDDPSPTSHQGELFGPSTTI